MDDATLIQAFVAGFHGVSLSDAHARDMASLVRGANDAAAAASAAMPFEAEASTFLLELEAGDDVG